MTVKSFTPPFAPFPEIYLLPVVENDSSLWSLTPDTFISNNEHHSHDFPRPPCPTAKTKVPVKFPSINKGLQRSLLMQDSEGDESDEDRQSTDTPHLPYSSQDQMESINKQPDRQLAKQKCLFQVECNATAKRKLCFKGSQQYSGPPEAFDDSHGLARKLNSSLTLKSSEDKPDNMVLMSRPTSPLPAESSSALSAYSLHCNFTETTTNNELIDEMKLLKEQRKDLEKTRQKLLKRGRELLALNKHRRNQARDRWKRQYFDTKKVTTLLENTLKGKRQELHTFYTKMLQQLQARDGAKHRTQTKKQSRPKLKNEFLIQIMTESSEIDNLRKNVDDAKIKLATEIKLRKQAATELQALRAELMQKRAQF